MLHRAEQGRSRPAVLLLNPFAQEAIRCHRLYRVLADRLARAGHTALRFDYHGTGDSAGDDEAIDIERWIGDIEQADAELRRRSGCAELVWVGARLGASLAALASARCSRRPVRIVLWEPVLSGRAYLGELWQRHIEHLVDTLGHAGDLPRAVAPETMREALGFALPRHFVGQMMQLERARVLGAPACPTHVIAPPGALAAWREPAPSASSFTELATPFDWNSEEALNSALVPAAAIQAISDAVSA
jgi:dienelactone hydrolase